MRKRVIDSAVKELCTHTNLSVNYASLKRECRVTSLEFSMEQKNNK
ncbi:MAG: replication initiation protein [Gammaproteobacteria bacterium]|nr:replication initiation protein [Gammaproteobacteria bacterium]